MRTNLGYRYSNKAANRQSRRRKMPAMITAIVSYMNRNIILSVVLHMNPFCEHRQYSTTHYYKNAKIYEQGFGLN